MTTKTKIDRLIEIESMEGKEIKPRWFYEAAVDTAHAQARLIHKKSGVFVSVSVLIETEYEEALEIYHKKVQDKASTMKFSFIS